MTTESQSQFSIINGNKNLIICFGGRSLQFGGILPFEFLNFLKKTFVNECDLIFFIDKHQAWYHNGIMGITSNINDTKIYINNLINRNTYKNVIFTGVSMGGYAAILFGSLCNVTNVLAFIPRTKVHDSINQTYGDLNTVINTTTKYTLYGDEGVNDVNSGHHISQVNRLKKMDNIYIVKLPQINMKSLRDNGMLYNIFNNIIHPVYEKYNPDIKNSSIYEASLKLNCNIKDNLQAFYNRNNTDIKDYSLNEQKTHMRCFKDTVLEDRLITDQFLLQYRCGIDNKKNNKEYSNNVGYACNREPNELLYNLDEYNTYHNYPVCKLSDDNKKMSCCPENIQIFNNWTRRHIITPVVHKKQDLIMEDQHIPRLTYSKCHLY
jgi:predicted esterase YcpF (UPF0227 family)